MEVLHYAIFVPKLSESNEVFYKDIVTMCIEGERLIGAKKWGLDGSSEVIPYLDLAYSSELVVFKTSIDHKPNRGDLKESPGQHLRTIVKFPTEDLAYAQKIIYLREIREIYEDREKRDRGIFDRKIPLDINKTFGTIKEEHPEYFL